MLIGGTIVDKRVFWATQGSLHQAWNGHLWASGLVRQNDVVNIYGDDIDFIALWVIVIPYITVWVCFCLGPHLGGFLFGSFCLLEVLQHEWDLLQFLHACCFWGFDIFLLCFGQDWGHWLHLLTELTVLDLRPIALRLPAMAMWAMHVSSILAVVALRSRVINSLTS